MSVPSEGTDGKGESLRVLGVRVACCVQPFWRERVLAFFAG